MRSALFIRVAGGIPGPLMLTPVVDGSPLTELAAEFESRRGYSPAGGYAGLAPAHFRFGDLVQYFLGQRNRQWPWPDYALSLAFAGCAAGG
ncbi:MAG: hypothetical protein LBI49_17925 [Nocardiopsaceae bacterium]|nr:hypothetical protein [Nocardiopsaceae bacterium]